MNKKEGKSMRMVKKVSGVLLALCLLVPCFSMVASADFTACSLHTDMKVTGRFSCSNEMVNQLQSNIMWGQRSNFLDIPTDCPQRDERLGR